MFQKIYRIQAYISWALVGGLFLLINHGNMDWLRSLADSGVLTVLTYAALARTVLPVGTVLAIFAKREGAETRSLIIRQLCTLLINLTMIYTMICVLVLTTGGA